MSVKGLAFITIILTYILIVFGGYVASSESGMGCGPEWPLCNGLVIPILEGDTLIEFAHRVIGAILGIISVALFLKIKQSRPDPDLKSASWGLMILLILQILLGAVVVLLDLPAIVVSIHLIIAMLFLANLIWIWGKIAFGNGNQLSLGKNRKNTAVSSHLNVVLLLVVLTLFLGAYIKHQAFGLACGWLECGNGFIPASIPGMFQTGHRLLAGVLAFYIFILTYISFKKRWNAGLQNRLMAASLIVMGQILIGIITIISYIEVSWAVLHLALGTALFAFVFETRVYASTVHSMETTLRAVKSRQQYLD
ncbi:COX15/CtaA family protein [Bacillus sp. ISL-47]|uniref:COX15/CtaA family protein n=1 Tax=Bacillus sp. ISL-47 TaxID=2819130 RepID=UPI001BEBD6EC|nr:COX15/CtaA family protein [Bacillus sp. ISL-47]MBT2688235.1 COX15/CtaA family protein [Bacillus sp. ISL-47]MBT2710028.1 COX15/CtaA family protein [Pseudomonas sp. ISL-84]